MTTVKIIFSKRKNIGSAFLRAFLWSRWSHCGILLDDRFVVEAKAFDGVIVSAVEDFLKDTSQFEIVEIPVADEDQRDEIHFHALSQLGHRYDWVGLVGLGLRSSRITSETKWFCSELIAWAFEEAKRPLLRILPWRVSPHHLYIPVFR